MKLKSYLVVTDTAENPDSSARIVARLHARDLQHAEFKRSILCPGAVGRLVAHAEWLDEEVHCTGYDSIARRDFRSFRAMTRATPVSAFGF